MYPSRIWHDCASVKIAAVHTAVVEGNYDWTYVRVDAETTDPAAWARPTARPGLTAIVRDLAPLLVGEDPRDVDRLWSKLRWGASGAGSPAGIVYNAISGMEAALWDLVGRHYGVPIHRLLGGRFRDSVRMYADCHAGEALESMDATMVARPARWAQEPPEAIAAGAIRAPEHGRAYAKAPPDELFTPELYAARAREVVAELGFSALKFDLDVPTPYMQDTASGTLSRAEIGAMVELAAAVIDAVGAAGRRGVRLPLALPGLRRASASRTSSSRSACSGWRTRCRRRTWPRCGG